jgi:hypothetical protein
MTYGKSTCIVLPPVTDTDRNYGVRLCVDFCCIGYALVSVVELLIIIVNQFTL